MPGSKTIDDMRNSILIISLLVLGCTSKSTEAGNNYEAILLHNSMLEKADHIEDRLNELSGDSLVNQDSVDLFTILLQHWKADLIEVPGNEAHDHVHQGHAHSHGTIPDITAEQMLAVQRELDQRLSEIGKRIADLKPELKSRQ